MRIQRSNRYGGRLNKFETKQAHEKHMERALHGEGLYVYRNKTNGDLSLPKPTASGQKLIGPGQVWQGDNYYMQLVPQMASLVKVIMTPAQEKKMMENKMLQEQKLILDQPDRVTPNGQVENVVSEPEEMLTETPDNDPKKKVLLTEDPLEGVQILRG